MKVQGLALLALLVCAPLAWATPPIPSPGCTGLKVWGWEFIEAQGFLGLATPKADGWEPSRALNELLKKPDSPAARYCELAKAYYKQLYGWDLKELTLACRSDSFSDQGTEMDRRDGPARIDGECLVALGRPIMPGQSPSFWDVKRYAVAYGFASENVPDNKNRHDLLDVAANRRRLYVTALATGMSDELDRESRGLGINLSPEYDRYKATRTDRSLSYTNDLGLGSPCTRGSPDLLPRGLEDLRMATR